MVGDPYRYFRIEARELLDELVKGILELDREGTSAETVKRVLRHCHTLKGAARVVKQVEIADHAHEMEGVLEHFRDSAETVPRDQLDIVFGLLDRIGGRLAELDPPRPPPTADTRPVDRDESVRTMRTEVVQLDELLDGLVETHARVNAMRADLTQVTQARKLADLVVRHLAGPSTANDEQARGTTNPDGLRALGGELLAAITAADQCLGDGIGQIDSELRQARDSAERLRLVPASTMFPDLERAARDVAHAQDKRVVFDARGGDVRLDAHVLATVHTALQQIVRNAVAHGIESEADRIAAGKAPEGLVRVDVTQRRRRTVFSCRDDGRGVDLEAVRATVLDRGIPASEAQGLGPDQLVELLLSGGMSTTGTVTEVSGRGIGLDIVRESIEHLRGEVSVTTTNRQGTTIELDVPLSLTALEALVFDAAGVTAAISLESVHGTVRVTDADIVSTASDVSLFHEGAAIPFLPLASLIAAPGHTTWSRPRTAVIVEGGRGLAAIGVHSLVGTAVIVQRPLPDMATASEAVAGVWIDLEGNPQIVLDADGLVAEAGRHHHRPTDESAPRLPILVTDDSLTTRMLEQSILESAGYEVDLAASGEEGLEKAGSRRYGVILVDVEMPGISGFTFIERIRADAELSEIPCILVTSRGALEDRQRGFDAGAAAFIDKTDFDQRELLDHINRLSGG